MIMEPNGPLIQWKPGLFPGLQDSGGDAEYYFPPGFEVNQKWSCSCSHICASK